MFVKTHDMKNLTILILFFIFWTGGIAQNADEYFSRGNDKFELGDYSGAIADFNKAIELNPNYVAYFGRGLSKLSLNDINGGCLDLSKAGELGHEKAYEIIRKVCN